MDNKLVALPLTAQTRRLQAHPKYWHLQTGVRKGSCQDQSYLGKTEAQSPDMPYHTHEGHLLVGRVKEEGGRCQLLPRSDDTPKEWRRWSLVWHRQAYSFQTCPCCIPAPEIGTLFHKYSGPDREPAWQPKSKGIQAGEPCPAVWSLLPATTLLFAVENNWIKCITALRVTPSLHGAART